MTQEEAIKGLKENLCSLCAYGSQNMDSCDIRGCDNRDYIKALEQPAIDKAMVHTLVEENEKLKADNKILAENCLKDLINCHSSVIKEQQLATLIIMAKKLEMIERIVNRPIGFSEEEKAYNYMIQVIDIKEVLEQE